MKFKKTLAAAALAATALATAPYSQADSYAEMFAAADYLGKQYGVTVYTSHEPMDRGTYAYTSGDLIVFNSNYINNPDVLRADLTTDVWNGFHPGALCSPEQAVAAHEFAHVLDNLTGHTADNELMVALANGLTGEVSGYSINEDGTVNTDEALADAFLAVECDVPTPAETALYNMLTT